MYKCICITYYITKSSWLRVLKIMADGCHFLDHNIKCAWMLYHVLRVMNVLVLKRIYSFIKTAVWSRLWCKTARYSARWAGVSFQRGTPEGASIQVSLCHQTLTSHQNRTHDNSNLWTCSSFTLRIRKRPLRVLSERQTLLLSQLIYSLCFISAWLHR